MASMSLDTRVRLSLMMFFQYMLVAVWSQQLSAYLDHLKIGGALNALIMSVMAFGCLASPLIGMFADRHFPSQKVLAVLNLGAGIMLFLSAQVTDGILVFICLLLTMLFYMPTWGLTSSIAMSHSPSEKFPQIRVFGSIGWVAASLFSVAALTFWGTKIDGDTNIPLYCGGAIALFSAALALFLPVTPPPAKGQKASIVDVLGLRSFTLFKHPDFALYVIVSILVSMAFSMYWSYCSVFLEDKGFKLLTGTQSLGQAVEIFVMLGIPFVIAKVGLKWAMVLGLLAQLVRYGSFLFGEIVGATFFAFLGVVVHGLIFGLFFVGGQIYVDRRAPKEMKAQAQGFMFLATFGVGLLIGNFLCKALIGAYTVDGIRHWQPIWMWTTVASAVALVLFVLLFKDTTKAPPQELAKEASPTA